MPRHINSTSNNHYQPVLRRIRKELLEVERLLQTENYINSKRKLQLCLRNIERIRNHLRSNMYSTVKLCIGELLLKCEQTSRDSQSTNREYTSERHRSGGRGRPLVSISRDQMLLFLKEGYTAADMANQFHCSTSVIYKKLYELGLKFRAKYSNLSDVQLFREITQLSQQYPNSGSELMCALLRSKGLFVQRNRVRKTLSAVNPTATAIRWGVSIQRRVYSVPTPNSLWHMDAHLKISRWGFVTHSCIDGYSRLITYSKCATSITAQTVLNIFIPSVKKYGLPSRIRSDHGYENIFVALVMNCIRGIDRGSHITGRSVHNQRVERLWRDIHHQVISTFYNEFVKLEQDGHLDIENNNHMFVLQFMYLDAINIRLNTFLEAWNRHRIRTMGRKTPRQLWISGMLSNINSNHTAINAVFNHQSEDFAQRVQFMFGDSTNESAVVQEDNSISRFTATANLNEQVLQQLRTIQEEEIEPLQKYLTGVRLII